MKNKKTLAALLSIISNSLLITIKVIAGIISGSVSIMSEAIHSGMDLLASFIAFFSVCYSGKPADKEHPYGHGKIENISGTIEGILIFIAAGLIIVEAIKKIIHPASLQHANIAILVMLISAGINLIISSVLYKVAKQEDSIALEADALHLKTDVYTSAGVGLGIILIKLTGLFILDPIVAILVALLIIKESYKLCSEALKPLLDSKIPDEEEDMILEIIKKQIDENEKVINYHALKTRKSGSLRFIDLHLIVDGKMSVEHSHTICDIIEEEIRQELPWAIINIHVEPHTVVTELLN